MDIITAVIFDLDETLVNLSYHVKDALRFICDHLGINYEQKYLTYFLELDEKLWSKNHQKSKTITLNEVPTKRFELFFEHFNLGYKDYEQANEWFKVGLIQNTYPLADAEKVLKHLKQSGYKIYVLTNGLSRLQRPRIEKSSLSKYINKIYVSEEIGSSKPKKAAFEYLLRDINLKKEEVVMIGDSLKNDIQGALDTGIKSIWFNPEKVKNSTNIKPNSEINELNDLIYMFDNLTIGS